MEDILLALVMIGALFFGYFVLKGFDSFIGENHESIEKEYEVKEPTCIMLTDDLSDEEIAEEIHRFRKKNNETMIYLYGQSHQKVSKPIDQ